MPMTLAQACAALATARGDAIVVATMGAMHAFDQLQLMDGRMSSVPLMGGAAGLGLGLAIAQPARRVIVVDGDASLLMQLGGLVTVATQAPTNLLHVLIRNGTQFTGNGNLSVPGAQADFVALARAAGYRHAQRIDSADEWAARCAAILAQDGPGFVELVVEPAPARLGAAAPQQEIPDRQFERMGQEAAALSAWLGVADRAQRA
jgi:thiamine pyrophosphate-dependent acetolactate synthase large subunit-like protein